METESPLENHSDIAVLSCRQAASSLSIFSVSISVRPNNSIHLGFLLVLCYHCDNIKKQMSAASYYLLPSHITGLRLPPARR